MALDQNEEAQLQALLSGAKPTIPKAPKINPKETNPLFTAPITSTPTTISGSFTADDEKRLQSMLNTARVATPFADMAANAKDFFLTQPANAAKDIREAAIQKMGAPSEEALVEQATKTGKPNIPGIIGRVAAETLGEAVPLTPSEIAATVLGGKAISAAAPIAARGLSNLALRTVGASLEAGLPMAEQALFRAGMRPGASATERVVGRNLPGVATDISRLSKGLINEQAPVIDLLAPPVLGPRKPPTTVAEAQASVEPSKPTLLERFKIRAPEDSSPESLRTAASQARKLSLDAIAVPKEYRTGKVNLAELDVLQNIANKAKEAALKNESRSIFGKVYSSMRNLDEYMATSGWKNLDRLGPVGQTLRTWGESALANAEIRAGGAKTVFRNAISTLNEAEKQNLIDVLDVGIAPLNSKIKIAAESIKALNSQIEKEATGLLSLKRGDSVIPWMGRENYFPHLLDTAKMEEILADKGSTRYLEMIKKVAEKNKVSVGEAENLIEDMVLRHKAANFGPLEKSRQFDSPLWIRDIDTALSTYYDGAFKRLEIAKAFGPQNEKGLGLISKISNRHQRDLARAVTNTLAGIQPITTLESIGKGAFSTPVRLAGNVVMGLSQMTNATQGVFGSAMRTGLPNALRSMRDAWVPFIGDPKAAREFAVASGSLIEDIAQEASNRVVSRDFLKKSGFEFFEEMNRIVSSNAAKYHAADLIKLIKEGSQMSYVERELQRLGINMSSVVKRGAFSDFEIKRMANAITNITQGRSRAIDLPLFTESAIGKVAFHLHNFAFNWTKMLNAEVKNEFLKGNTRPLRNLLATGAILGEPMAQFRSKLSGRERPTKLPIAPGLVAKMTSDRFEATLARRADAIGWLGGLGIAKDSIDAAVTGRGSQLLIPPMASAGLEATKAISDVVRGPGDSTKKLSRLETAVKYAGRRLSPLVLSAVPAPLAIPYLVGARYAGEHPKGTIALGKKAIGAVAAGGMGLYGAIKKRLLSKPNLGKQVGSTPDESFSAIQGRKPVLP